MSPLLSIVLASMLCADAPEWGSDIPAAQESGRRSGKPLLLVFRCER